MEHKTDFIPKTQEQPESPATEVDNNNDCHDCHGEYKGDVWIQCNICLKWYHCFCVNVPECEINEIDQFHCTNCAPKCGPSIMKPIRNRHRYDRTQTAEGLPVQVGTGAFIEELTKRKFPIFDQVHVLPGEEVNMDYLCTYGFRLPILVNKMNGLNLKIPQNFSLDYLVDKLGEDYMLEVIDVHYQQTTKMKLVDLVSAMKDTTNRSAILNCISLELSSTNLSRQVEPPAIVRNISWVENCWSPDDPARPQVSKYCLISMAHSYTDFHIDFSGTSVWYHILKGKKLFYFIEPTPENLKKYEEWMNKENYTEIFFPDMIESKCSAFMLTAGQTMFIPTGWIHAVYTPEDSVVFGGNFLHAFNIPLQMDIFELEDRVGTTDKFKFPFYEYTHWFACDHVLKIVKKLVRKTPKYSKKNRGLSSVLKGIRIYVQYLKGWNLKAKQNAAEGKEDTFLVPLDFDCAKALKELQQVVEQYKHITYKDREKTKERVPKNEIPSYSIFKKAFETLPNKRNESNESSQTNSTTEMPRLQSLLLKYSKESNSFESNLTPPRKKRPVGDATATITDHDSNQKSNNTITHTSLPAAYFAAGLSNFKIPKRKRENSSTSDAHNSNGTSNSDSNVNESHRTHQTESASFETNFFAKANESQKPKSFQLASFMQTSYTDSTSNEIKSDCLKDELLDSGCSTSTSSASASSPDNVTSNLTDNNESKGEPEAWSSIDVYYNNSIYSH